MRPGRHAKSPSKDRCDARESKRDVRRVDHAEALPVPATTGPGSPAHVGVTGCQPHPDAVGIGIIAMPLGGARPEQEPRRQHRDQNDTPPVRAYHLHAAPPSRGSADI